MVRNFTRSEFSQIERLLSHTHTTYTMVFQWKVQSPWQESYMLKRGMWIQHFYRWIVTVTHAQQKTSGNSLI